MAARDEGEPLLRQRVIVLPFLTEGNISSNAAAEARKYVARELARNNQYVMVDPEEMKEDLAKKIIEGNEYNIEGIAKLASMMGVAALIEGKILDVKVRRVGDQVGIFREVKAEVKVKVRMRVFAARNGSELFSEMREAMIETSSTRLGQRTSSDAELTSDPALLREALSRAFSGSLSGVSLALEKLNWQGRVAMVNGERVFVNAGRLSGLQLGDVLKISEEGDEIFDPQSGRFIGKSPGRMKGTVEVVSYFGKDGAITVIHSGSGFKENDLVELY